MTNNMKKYEDYKDLKEVEWTRYKIVVPTEEDRQELMKAFKYLHYSDIDTDYVAVNQLIHEYLTEEDLQGNHNNIIVDKELYEKLNK